jgi:hypothetical protein
MSKRKYLLQVYLGQVTYKDKLTLFLKVRVTIVVLTGRKRQEKNYKELF